MAQPNWLGEATINIPNNTILVNGVPVNAVPNLVDSGNSSNLYTWSNGNFFTFHTSPTVPAGRYLVGCELFTSPLLASNAQNGWNQGDYFQVQISDNNNTVAGALQTFIRPYTEGVQSNAVANYNKGGTNQSMSGFLVLNSNSPILYTCLFGKDSNTSYPQTRQLAISGAWYQRIG